METCATGVRPGETGGERERTTTTSAPASRAAVTSERWPSCKKPMVGIRPTVWPSRRFWRHQARSSSLSRKMRGVDIGRERRSRPGAAGGTGWSAYSVEARPWGRRTGDDEKKNQFDRASAAVCEAVETPVTSFRESPHALWLRELQGRRESCPPSRPTGGWAPPSKPWLA